MTNFSLYYQRMRCRRICIPFLTLIIATASTPLTTSFQGFLSTSQVLAQTTNTRKAEADRLFQQGIQKYQAKELSDALTLLLEASKIYTEIKDIESMKLVLKQILIVENEYYSKFENLLSTADRTKWQAQRFYRQGLSKYGEKEFEAALKLFQQALTIFQEIQDIENTVSVMKQITTTYSDLGNYPKAIDYLQQSLTIARSRQNHQEEADILQSLGLVYLESLNYPKAIDYLQQSLTIARKTKDWKLESLALGLLGNTYHHLGNFSKAIEFQEQGLAIIPKIEGYEAEIRRTAKLIDLANSYRNLGNFPKTIDYLEQGLRIARKFKSREFEKDGLIGMGSIYIYLGDFPRAIDYLQQALAITRETKNRRYEGMVLANLGVAYNGMRDYAKGIEYQKQALVIMRQFNDLNGEIVALITLGFAHRNQGEYLTAIDYLQQSLAIIQKIKSHYGESTALGNLGFTYVNLGDYPKAIRYLQQAVAIARETKERGNEGWALSSLGYIFYKQGNFANSEKTLVEAMKVLESLRDKRLDDTNKISLFDTQRDTYRTLQQVLIAQNKINPALEIAERGRARAFAELLASRLSSKPKDELSVNPPNIQEIKQIAKAQNTSLVEYSVVHDEIKVKGKPQINESKLNIWVIKPTGEVVFRQVDFKTFAQKKGNKSVTSIADLVPQLRQTINVRASGTRGELAFSPGDRIRFKDDPPNSEPYEIVSVDAKKGTVIVKHPTFAANVTIPRSINDIENKGQTSLQLLHELLIEPITDLLPTNPDAHVTFIPHNELFLVPFAALQDKTGKYLIEKHTILTAPSIQVLDLNHQKQKRTATDNKSTLVVGNPMPNKIGSLPYAEQEANTIANLLGTKAITGSQAKKSDILNKLPSARIIHLAVHGILDEGRGLGSAIALAPSGQDDGLLKAEEIIQMKLGAELVVLSACDTGRGKITGDGVIGLSRSLISAGAESVIASLWKVPDNTTAPLMVEFYRNWQRNPDKAVALRQAMLTTMKQYPDPVDWAAFALIGDPE